MDVIEASQLGLAPGNWPPFLTYKGQLYEKVAVESRYDEVLSVTYVSLLNSPRMVKVFND